MMAEEILKHLSSLGVEVEVDGTKLRLIPGSLVPSALESEVRVHKGELLQLLNAPRLVDAEAQWHAHEVARRVEHEGICVFWADELKEMIAFVAGESDLPLVPAGLVAFTPDELEHIFPQGKDGLSPGSLRLIYEAKQLGDGKVIDVEWKADGC